MLVKQIKALKGVNLFDLARAILSSLYAQKMLSDIQNLCRRETEGNREEARFDYYEVEGMIK
jgi:hypothetical protein